MSLIAVECTFSQTGAVQVRRIAPAGQWQPVTQGRQWVDEQGRHVLIMLGDGPVQRLWLRKDTMTWSLMPLGQQTVVV